jgi:hypothetical protein
MFPVAAALTVIEMLGNRPKAWKAEVARQMLILLNEPTDQPEPPAPELAQAAAERHDTESGRVEITTPPTEPEPAELPPEQRLDDGEFKALWVLRDGDIKVEDTGIALYFRGLDAPAVRERLKARKLIRPYNGKTVLTALGQKLLAANNTDARTLPADLPPQQAVQTPET